MNSQTLLLLKQHQVTEDMLSNYEASIEINMLGRRDFVNAKVDELNLQVQVSDARNLTGAQKAVILGNVGGILNLLDMCSDQFGKNFQIGVFVAAVGCYVLMTVLQAREYYIEKIKEEQRKNEYRQE